MKMLTKILFSFLVLAAALPSVSMADALDSKEEAFDSAALPSEAVLSDKELDTYRGGSSESLLTNNMNAVFQNNTCNSCMSGANTVSNSFNNITGLTNVVMNSGNNVVIQSSFQVNVNFGQ
jgi:hypothetical protein